ncbi:unnamed protein product [Nezara viridula]|uniref:RAWUL domain-containing protein n=1 Tax=Nezara viridula TaxID=85310 RepID=A0A9P0HJ34_NEZVI|nr:unnamed protein product [Nezara viridula]
MRRGNSAPPHPPPAHRKKVDIMYRRECLPDSYSLMDVAYIYTWKRNSPMRFYYRMPDVVMKQLTAPPPEIPCIKSTEDNKEKEKVKESDMKSPSKSVEKKPEENKEEANNENNDTIAKVAKLDTTETPEKLKVDGENKEEEKPKTAEIVEQTNSISSSRALSKQDELSVSVLLSLGQCRVDNKDDHKFLVPNPVTPKNGMVEKRNGKVSPKPSVNKIASDLAEHKAQQPQVQNSSPQTLPNSMSTPNQQLNMSPQQKQQQLQKQKIQQMQQQKKQQQLKNQHVQQQKQQQFLHQKQQMHQLMQQQQQKLQQQLQQQHLLQQQQFQQVHLQQVQRHQMQQLQTQPQILQFQVQPQLQLQHVIHQIKETKPQDQQSSQLVLAQQSVVEQPVVTNQVKQVANQILKVPKSPPVLHQSQVQSHPPQHLVQQQPSHLSQQQPSQHLVQQQSSQHLVQQQPPQHLVQQQPSHMSQQQPPHHLAQQSPTTQTVSQEPTQQLGQQQRTQSPMQSHLSQQTAHQQIHQQPMQQQSTQQSAQQQQTQQSTQQQQTQQSVPTQPTQQLVQAQTQKPQNQQIQPHQSPQHQKSWPEPATPENPPINGTTGVQNPQVTLNTSNGSVTIMAQLKSPPIVSSTVGATANTPGSPIPTMNGKSPETPRPQGIHQNLPRTVLPKSPFVNGKPLQKSIQQKNISGQRLNNNLPEGKNGIIQQSNINNRLPTFQKNGGSARKAGVPGGVLSKTGPTLDQRIQQLYNSGQTNKPPSPGGKSESRLASWLNNRFKPQPVKEEAESTTPASPPTTKEVSMQRYKRKLQEMQKVQEICEITQENPKPDDAKKRREVTPDVSIELMRAADMKKLDSTKKEKRPVPGLKSIQEVGAKRKKEEDSALDLSRPQLPWLLSRPTHYIPSPRPT